MAESMYVVNLEGEIRVQRAEEIRQELRRALLDYEQVFLNVSRVSDIDLSFIHLLYAARQYAEFKKRQFRLTGTFQEVVLRRLQMGGFLEKGVPPAAREVDAALLPMPEQNDA